MAARRATRTGCAPPHPGGSPSCSAVEPASRVPSQSWRWARCSSTWGWYDGRRPGRGDCWWTWVRHTGCSTTARYGRELRARIAAVRGDAAKRPLGSSIAPQRTMSSQASRRLWPRSWSRGAPTPWSRCSTKRGCGIHALRTLFDDDGAPAAPPPPPTWALGDLVAAGGTGGTGPRGERHVVRRAEKRSSATTRGTEWPGCSRGPRRSWPTTPKPARCSSSRSATPAPPRGRSSGPTPCWSTACGCAANGGLPTRDACSGSAHQVFARLGASLVDRGRRGGAPRRRGPPRATTTRRPRGGSHLTAQEREIVLLAATGSQQQGDRADPCSSRHAPWAPTSITRSPSSESPHATSSATWLTPAAGRLTSRGINQP